MIDKTQIPYLGVLLTKKDTDVFTPYSLPEGYQFCSYEPGLELEWVKLNMLFEVFESFAQAISYFQTVFLTNPELTNKQLLFVKDASGLVVATACLWEGMHFGVAVQRIQFLAIHPFHRNKGISKAMISKLLEVYQDKQYQTGIYVSTQTWSFAEINLFFMFGFVAYTGPKPPRWNGTAEQFDYNKNIAWKIIRDNIGVRTHETL